MLNVDVYFNNERDNSHVRFENVIMVQTINNELIILYKIENYDYHHIEIKRYSMDFVDYYVVSNHK